MGNCCPTIVKQAGRLGLGLFAQQSFSAGSIIERAPIVWIDYPESDLISHFTKLGSYIFHNYDDGSACIAFGHVSFCNHSTSPNADYAIGDDFITLTALKDIRKGAQIKINYNGNPSDRTRIDFKLWK